MAALLLAVCLLSGCGGSSPPSQAAPRQIDVPLRLVDCTDWRNASVDERRGTVVQLREFAGGPSGSPAGHGTVLDDDDAYTDLDNFCENDFARAFRLYKLYVRAAAFQSAPGAG